MKRGLVAYPSPDSPHSRGSTLTKSAPDFTIPRDTRTELCGVADTRLTTSNLSCRSMAGGTCGIPVEELPIEFQRVRIFGWCYIQVRTTLFLFFMTTRMIN